MGLAVLPSRLKSELALVKEYILENKSLRDNEATEKHADWVDVFKTKYDKIDESNIDEIIEREVGLTFCRCLEDAGVYKQTNDGLAAFIRFTESVK